MRYTTIQKFGDGKVFSYAHHLFGHIWFETFEKVIIFLSELFEKSKNLK